MLLNVSQRRSTTNQVTDGRLKGLLLCCRRVDGLEFSSCMAARCSPACSKKIQLELEKQAGKKEGLGCEVLSKTRPSLKKALKFVKLWHTMHISIRIFYYKVSQITIIENQPQLLKMFNKSKTTPRIQTKSDLQIKSGCKNL